MNEPAGHETLGKEINEYIVHCSSNVQEVITTILAQGLTVDDDNKLASKNIPPPNVQNEIDESTGLFGDQKWKWNDICQCKVIMQRKETASFHNWTPCNKSLLDVFLHLMPTPWLEMTVLEATNKSLKNAKEPEMTIPELYVFFGLWFLMATADGFTR